MMLRNKMVRRTEGCSEGWSGKEGRGERNKGSKKVYGTMSGGSGNNLDIGGNYWPAAMSKAVVSHWWCNSIVITLSHDRGRFDRIRRRLENKRTEGKADFTVNCDTVRTIR